MIRKHNFTRDPNAESIFFKEGDSTSTDLVDLELKCDSVRKEILKDHFETEALYGSQQNFDKSQNADRIVSESNIIIMPIAQFSNNGIFKFIDGRHRFKALCDYFEYETIPFTFRRKDVELAKKLM